MIGAGGGGGRSIIDLSMNIMQARTKLPSPPAEVDYSTHVWVGRIFGAL